MSTPIQLIVGLGNPGREYEQTRHNAGIWLVERLAQQENIELRTEKKFFGAIGKISLGQQDCWLLIPNTYMNLSGQATQAVTNFYRIEPQAILVAHDELDLPVGTARLKQGGGDGGHNGLRDITAKLNCKNYWRLRIGIGHPGHRDRVHDYVLSKPSRSDHDQILTAIENAITILPQFVSGEHQKATQQLHTQG